MQKNQTPCSLTWVHVGDLHITAEHEANYQDFRSIIESINAQLIGQIDFCVLPGDNADDGTAGQYASIRAGLDTLEVPTYIIPGDHDRKPGNLDAFYRGLDAARLPFSVSMAGYRCIFLDVVSDGSGGPDFALGGEQLRWLEAELQSATLEGQRSVVFTHTYPADLKSGRQALQTLLHENKVAFVDMGHTHYNELANDGTTIFATTRSTGQIEEGPVGFSIASLNRGVVSWRFKPLRSSWPFVMITSPADHRLITDRSSVDPIVSTQFRVTARVFGANAVNACRCRIDQDSWVTMHLEDDSSQWCAVYESPENPFHLTVEATDILGGRDTDTIVVATSSYRPPHRQADGSDSDSVGAWPERHLLATRLGPNRNGRQW